MTVLIKKRAHILLPVQAFLSAPTLSLPGPAASHLHCSNHLCNLLGFHLWLGGWGGVCKAGNRIGSSCQSITAEQAAKHLVIGLFQPLKATRWTNQGSLYAATAKEQLEVKWTGEKTCDWANAVKASMSPFSMSTVSRVKGRQMQNYNRQGEGGNVSLSP